MLNKLLPFLSILTLASCASQTTPQGGPQDEEPPILLNSNPREGQTNYKATEITLEFHELIKLKNPKEEIIIIPPVGKKTEFVAKKTKLIIKPEQPWKENTTYTINFREAVEDITEGNSVEGLKLAFSTGTFIDSLILKGKITDGLLETIPENITVAIFESDTFDIFNHTPEYFTKADETGAFEITNLKPGDYRIYAFQDKNKNLKVESKTEKFGFKSNKVNPLTDTSSIDISVVQIDSRPLKLNSVRTQADVNTIRFNKPLDSYTIKGQAAYTTYGTDQTEVIAYFPTAATDSLQIGIYATDSLQQKVDTLIYIKKDKNEKIKEGYRATLSDPVLNLETGKLSFDYTFNKPIAGINFDSLRLEYDSAFYPFKKTDIRIDTVKKKLYATKQISGLDKKSKTKPQLHLDQSAFISIDQDSSRNEIRPVKTITTENSATVNISIETKEPNFIVEVLDLKNQLIETRKNEKKITIRHLEPTTIKIRVIIDSNNNGKWDSSNYLTNKEPEKVIYFKTIDDKFETPLRANWEVGPLLIKF